MFRYIFSFLNFRTVVKSPAFYLFSKNIVLAPFDFESPVLSRGRPATLPEIVYFISLYMRKTKINICFNGKSIRY
jgi:hypothetical protein